MKNIKIFQIDAFTKKPFEGNSAGVAFAENLTEEEMQKIAREMNVAETAFLSESTEADYNLRWFTPTVEVNLCGHATIASLHFLHENNLIKDNSEVSFKTLSGILNCGMKDGQYFMQIPIYSLNEFNRSKKEIIEALGIKKDELAESVPFIIAENNYLYIYLKTLDSLGKVRPDFNALMNLSNEFDCIALFTLETIEKESFAHGRFFAPAYGINEDPVTGSMNGPLILVLHKLGFIKGNDDFKLIFEQGDFIKRSGRVTVVYSPKRKQLYISGNAVTVLKGAISF
jgi:PhzF family phenazine biosynthesis protein